MLENEGRLRFLRRSTDPRRNRLRRGVYLLPSLLTMGNMFCGYACVVYAMRGEYATAAPFIGFAVVLDMLDGRIARLTNTTSEFGVEFDSMADIISFGIAPAILSFSWGLQALGRLGWAAGFMFVAAAAMRLARFNIQSGGGGDKRYFVGMPSPAAAAIPAATVFAYPWGLYDYRAALPALAMVLVPAALMVSTIRFRSFKTLDSKARRPYTVLIFVAAAIVAIATHPQWTLVVIAYSYLASGFIGLAITRFKHRGGVAATDVHAARRRSPRQRRTLISFVQPRGQAPWYKSVVSEAGGNDDACPRGWRAVMALLIAAPVLAQDGAALYSQRCASCHEGGQVARAPGRDVIAALTPDRIVSALESGTMRVQGESLTPDQRRLIATYLSTARPAPAGAPPVPAPNCAAGSALRTTANDWRAWGVTPANDRFQRQPGFSSAADAEPEAEMGVRLRR